MPGHNHLLSKTKRGDTVIEVMLAFAMFSLAALLSIGMMNRGMNSAETALELSTSRNEINAQAEAIRFIHASYNSGGKTLWDKMIGNALSASDAQDIGIVDLSNYILTPDDDGVSGCRKVYQNMNNTPTDVMTNGAPLQKVRAFVLNTHAIDLSNAANADAQYFSTRSLGQVALFQPAELSARIVYGSGADNLTEGKYDSVSNKYDVVKQIEGLWVYVVKSDLKNETNSQPLYYDFYIDACWYGTGANTPTVLDTAIRLYNPEAM